MMYLGEETCWILLEWFVVFFGDVGVQVLLKNVLLIEGVFIKFSCVKTWIQIWTKSSLVYMLVLCVIFIFNVIHYHPSSTDYISFYAVIPFAITSYLVTWILYYNFFRFVTSKTCVFPLFDWNIISLVFTFLGNNNWKGVFPVSVHAVLQYKNKNLDYNVLNGLLLFIWLIALIAFLNVWAALPAAPFEEGW